MEMSRFDYDYQLALAHQAELRRQADADRLANEVWRAQRAARPTMLATSRRVISNLSCMIRTRSARMLAILRPFRFWAPRRPDCDQAVDL
jgi:hypothetical protein